MAVPERMPCIAEECPSPMRCNASGGCREAVADVWRSVAYGFETLRKEGRVPKGWQPGGPQS